MTDPFEFRSIDGTGNNLTEDLWGSSGSLFLRKVQSSYGDDVASMGGEDRPSAREISNAVMAQDGPILSALGTSDVFWLWGQFLDHDIDLTAGHEAGAEEHEPIAVPTGDPHFDPFNTGTQEISFTRSGYDAATGTDSDNPREQVNEITAFIDASMVYGSDDARAAALRDAGGKLKTSAGDMLPFDDGSFPNAGGPGGFLAGDVRANENVALSSMHTLFVREHNRLVDELAAEHPDYDDERLYQEAKALVEAKIQVITVKEFLPLLLGENPLGDYEGYKPDVDPSIANIFATAAYRVGHTMLSSTILRMDEKGNESADGHLALRDAFFRPDRLLTEGGIDPILRGVAANISQEIDTRLVDDVRNFLFGPPGSGGFDLGSLNIQRGRDHGLPSYNEAREAYGLAKVTSFAEITSDTEIADGLAEVYDTVDDIDVFVGGLAEDHVEGAVVGALFHAVLTDQFTRLRDGDRFWYENRYDGEQLEALEATKLSDIILANTGIEAIQDYVMLAYNRIGGTHGNDRMTGTWDRDLMMGGDGRDKLWGEESDDQIHGGRGRDMAFGGDGDDKVMGEEGRDWLFGNDGNDWILGGKGRDVAVGGDGKDHIEGGDGGDWGYGGDGDDHMEGGNGWDRLFGGDDNDWILGEAGRDMAMGGRGNDHLEGGAGRDWLYGGRDDDLLEGGWDADRMKGGSGDDTMIGGHGRDFMMGGRGEDSYIYESILDFGDVILDFNPFQDILDLRPISETADVEVSLTRRGTSTFVKAEVDGGPALTVAKLHYVHPGRLEIGDDPGDNILV